MSRGMSKVLLAAAVVGLTSVAALAQQSTTSETKTFEVIAVQGNHAGRRACRKAREN